MKTLATIVIFSSLLASVGVEAAKTNPVEPGGPAKVAALNRVSINKATAPELADALHGIGLKKAMEIVEYRRTHGPFKSVQDLINVKGIGTATLLKNKNRLTL